jgi:transposase
VHDSEEVASVPKRFRQPSPEKALQEALLGMLPGGHLVHFINDVVQSLDLGAILGAYQSLAGQPPYDPTMMVKVWLYAYCEGIRSSRRVEKALRENIAFRVLSDSQLPGHWTLNQFRKRHREALADLFYQTVRLAQKLNLIGFASVAIDGTKIKANASSHSAMSYKRMVAEEARLKALIGKYLDDCDEADREDTEKPGGGGPPAQLPEELATKQKRLAAIQTAKKELEDEAVQCARAEQQERRQKAIDEGRRFIARKNPEKAVPDPKAQRNFTDSESRIMKGSGGEFLQAYNGQAAVDSAHQVIVAADLSNMAADAPHLLPMAKQVIRNTGVIPFDITADAGYCSEKNLTELSQLAITPVIPPERVKHSTWRQGPTVDNVQDGLSATEFARQFLATEAGRLRYKPRKQTVEPTFGQTKEARGLRQFLHRGLEKVRSFWLLECAAHNLLKIFRFGGLQAAGC